MYSSYFCNFREIWLNIFFLQKTKYLKRKYIFFKFNTLKIFMLFLQNSVKVSKIKPITCLKFTNQSQLYMTQEDL